MDMCTIHTCIVVHTCIRIKDHRYTDHLRERRSQAGSNEGPIPEYWSGDGGSRNHKRHIILNHLVKIQISEAVEVVGGRCPARAGFANSNGTCSG